MVGLRMPPPSFFLFCELTSQNNASLLVTLNLIDKPAITHTSRGLSGQGSQTSGLRGLVKGLGNTFRAQGHL